MTGKKRHSGPKPKLTLEQATELQRWHAEVRALGQCKDAMRSAAAEWRKKRRALGYLKQKAAEFGVCPNTVHDYTQGRHKWLHGSRDSSVTGWRGPASGTAAVAGTGKPATGATAAAPSTNSATSTTARLRLSVQNVEIEYEG